MIGRRRETKSYKRSFVENGDLVEQAAEQLAVLLWKTWLQQRKTGRKEKDRKPP